MYLAVSERARAGAAVRRLRSPQKVARGRVPLQQRRALRRLPFDARLDEVRRAGRPGHRRQGRRSVHARADGRAGRVLRPQHHADGARRLDRRRDRARHHDRRQQARRGALPGDAVSQLRRARPDGCRRARRVHPDAQAAARRRAGSIVPLPDAGHRADAAAAGAPDRAARSDGPVAYGGYLVRMAGCAECHATRDAEGGACTPGMQFAGGMEFRFPAGRHRPRARTSRPMPTPASARGASSSS